MYINDIENRIFNVNDFPTWEIQIDFSEPAEIQNKLVKLTLDVEKECPVGKYFGVSGIGEGIVWSHKNEDNELLQFKVKGEAHSTSRVKKLASVDPEKMANIKEFVEYSVTDNRLNQAIEEVFTVNNIEPDMKNTGDFLKWVKSDIFKEEMDVMKESKLEPKDVVPALSKATVTWFKEFIFTV